MTSFGPQSDWQAAGSSALAPPVARLIEQLHKLPGIGPKTAQRLAYYLIRMPEREARELADAIGQVKESLGFCPRCQNIAPPGLCGVCSDPARDQTRICVVQEPLDVVSLERAAAFKGLYHVLHGLIDPMSNVGPDDLRIRDLLRRVGDEPVEEVIIAVNPTVEGEATAMYLRQLLRPLGPRVTRLARGLPVGGDLEYADDLTLARALEGRQDF